MADKNTLNGALEELGKLMATNLTTKGVASTYDMGLTTLANRILLINGGGELTISLTSDKDILSYADSDSATLTATVLEDSSAVSGETVDFYRYVDGTNDVLLGSDVTDSNGEASYTYASTGVGDIQVYAKVRTLSSETFSLEDAIYFNTMTSAPSGWTIPTNANATYSSNGMKLQGSAWTDCYLEVPLTKPYSVEFDLTEWTGSTTYSNYFWDSTKSTRQLQMYKTDAGKTVLDAYPSYNNSYSGSIAEGSHVKIEINNDNAKLYVNDELKLTKSYNMPSSSIYGVATGTNRTTTWKNIKIKPL